MTLGIAQQLFLAGRAGNTPWSESEAPSWILVYQAFDREIAKTLLKELGLMPELCLATLCHLSAAVQQGHLCIRVANGRVTPSVSDLFGTIEGDQHALEQMIDQGFDLLKNTIGNENRLLSIDQGRLYFQRHWTAETRFLQHLTRLQSAAPLIHINNDIFEKEIACLLQQGALEPEQAEAIRHAGGRSVTVITGGPGTGKTYTAGHCLRTLWMSLSSEQHEHLQISLVAPTGKAAANLEASVSRFLGSLPAFPVVKAQTLHALIGRKRTSDPAIAISSDLILVDECSMIDAQLFAELVSAVKLGARLILMGDAEQLPAVEAGGLFADLVNESPQLVTRLKVCRRAESHAILDFSAAVRQADWNRVKSLFSSSQDVQQISLKGPLQAQYQQLLDHAMPLFHCDVQSLTDPQRLAHYIRAFRMLSPLRKGPWGVESLNAQFWQETLKRGVPYAPIMIVKNDYEKELFNGDIGILVHSHTGTDDAYFLQQGTVRRLPVYRLPPYEFAFCLSVHKSQGSEFNHVLLIVPEGSEHFGRGLFYTAATRARGRLDVIGADDTLERMMQQDSVRLSGVAARLQCVGKNQLSALS